MLTEEQKIRAIELYFKYGKKLAPVVREPGYSSKRNQQSSNRSWEQMVAQKNPFVISTVTPMSKNRLPLNIILTTAAAWRLPAEPWVIPALMCSLG